MVVINGGQAILLFAYLGNAVDQCSSIGVTRVVEDLVGGAVFDNFAAKHNDHLVGKSRYDAKIVRDEDYGHADFLPEGFEQVDDLFLNSDIEGGCRLVGDQDFWAAGQGHSDHDALLHAATEFMGIGAIPLGGVADADLLKQANDLSFDVWVVRLVELDGFSDLIADREYRVEGRSGLLKDVGYFFTAVGPDGL